MNTEEVTISHHLRKLIEKMLTNLNLNPQQIFDDSLTVSPGGNWLGEISHITITAKNNKEQVVSLNLIAKSAPTSELYREFLSIHSAYDREIFMYRTVLPEFVNIQRDNKIKNIFDPFPKYYGSVLDKTPETILLENMKLRGYRIRDHRRPIDYKHAALIMKYLGKLHALSFALREHKPKLFNELSKETRDTFFCKCECYLAITKNMGLQALNHFGKHNPIYSKFENFIKNPTFVIDKILKPELAGEYAVVCHGDDQTKNFLFKYDNKYQPDTPTDLCFLDLQISRLGSPCLDIAFFIWICTTKKFRDRHYEELLEIYYSSFSQFLRELGGCPEKSYPVHVFKEHLKVFSVFGLFASIWLVSLNITKSTDAPDFQGIDNINTIFDRFSVISNDKYYEIINDILEDFIKYDYDF